MIGGEMVNYQKVNQYFDLPESQSEHEMKVDILVVDFLVVDHLSKRGLRFPNLFGVKHIKA